MTEIKIVIDDQLSLAQLVELMLQGHSIQRSCHIGNVYAANLAVGTAGIPLILYDRTMSEVDVNYHPQLLVRNGRAERLPISNYRSHRFVPFMEFEPGHGFPAANPAALHVQQLRHVLPQTDIHTFSAHLIQMWPRVVPVLRLLMQQLDPKLIFDRLVMPDGQILQARFTDHNLIHFTNRPGDGYRKEVVHRNDLIDLADELHHCVARRVDGNMDFPSVKGPLISLRASAVIDTLVETMITGKYDVYHLSGPDMYRYVGRMQGWLDQVVELLKPMADQLPAGRITLHVIPSADLRLVTDEQNAERLEAVLDVIEQAVTDRQRNRERAQGSLVPSAEMIAEFRAQKQSRATTVSRLIKVTDVFYDIASANYLNQHDLDPLAGRGLYLPERVRQMNMAELDSIMRRLRNLSKAA